MSSVLGLVRGATAVATATASRGLSWTTRKLSERTWKAALRRVLRQLCVSYEWVEVTSGDGAPATAVIRNLVLRPEVFNVALARVGWILVSDPGVAGGEEGEDKGAGGNAPLTIGSATVTVTLRLRGDLGLFSEPWRIEMVRARDERWREDRWREEWQWREERVAARPERGPSRSSASSLPAERRVGRLPPARGKAKVGRRRCCSAGERRCTGAGRPVLRGGSPCLRGAAHAAGCE